MGGDQSMEELSPDETMNMNVVDEMEAPGFNQTDAFSQENKTVGYNSDEFE